MYQVTMKCKCGNINTINVFEIGDKPTPEMLADDYFPNYRHLFWTTELPTKEGWYWAKTKAGIYIFNLTKGYRDELYFESIGEWWEAAMNEYRITHWLGPIPEPEPPQEERVKMNKDNSPKTLFGFPIVTKDDLPNGKIFLGDLSGYEIKMTHFEFIEYSVNKFIFLIKLKFRKTYKPKELK